MLVVTTPEGFPHSENPEELRDGGRFSSFPFLKHLPTLKQIPGGTWWDTKFQNQQIVGT